MQPKARDVIIGFLVIAVILLASFLFVKKLKSPKILPTPTPTSVSYQKDLEKTFNYQFPADLKTYDLKDITGGDSRGLASKEFKNGVFEVTVLADLPEPQTDSFYEAWLVDNGNYLYLGKLRIAKGGFVVDYQSNKDYSNYKKIVVSEEKIDDKKIEKVVLEGSF